MNQSLYSKKRVLPEKEQHNRVKDKTKKHRSPPRRSAFFSPSATSRLSSYSSSLTAAGPIVENTGYRFPRIGENCCRYSVRAPPLAPGAKALVPFTAGPSTRPYRQVSSPLQSPPVPSSPDAAFPRLAPNPVQAVPPVMSSPA